MAVECSPGKACNARLVKTSSAVFGLRVSMSASGYLLFVHQHDSRGSGPPSTVACRAPPMLSSHAFDNGLLLLLLLSPLPAYLPCFRSQACIRHFLCCAGRSTIPTPKARIRGPFEMQQRQFPVRLAFVMTNNKVQGQNLCQSGPTCPNLPSHMASCMLLAPMSVLGTVCVFGGHHHHHSHQHQNHRLQVAALFVSSKKKFSNNSLYLPAQHY